MGNILDPSGHARSENEHEKYERFVVISMFSPATPEAGEVDQRPPTSDLMSKIFGRMLEANIERAVVSPEGPAPGGKKLAKRTDGVQRSQTDNGDCLPSVCHEKSS